MVQNDFYSTTTTQYTVEYTDVINNLTYVDSETMAAPYYMGYISWDDVPSILHMSKFNVVSGVEEAYVEFLDVTQAENVPWFFTGRYSTSSVNAYGTYIVNDSDKYTSPSVGSGGSYGFFNNLEIQRVTTIGNYSLYVFYNLINPATTPPTYTKNEGYLLYNSSQNISFFDFQKWVAGEIALYIAVTIDGVTENIEFSFDDFATGYCEKEHANGTVQFYLADYSTPYSGRDVQPNNTLAGYSNTSVGTLLHAEIDDIEKPYITNTFTWHTGYANEKYIRIDYAQTLTHYVGGYDGYLMGGFNGRIPYTFFSYATTDRFYTFGNMVAWKYTASQTRVARVFTSYEIAKIYSSLFTRIITSSAVSYGYSDSIAYPLFNDDNSPKWEYVTGNLETIQQQLQQWQYTNIIENDFTASDIPEYTPTPPEPGDEEETGDSIIRPSSIVVGSTSGFLTQYVLNAANVSALGAALWSGIGDANFWQNVLWTTLTASASFDVSSLLQYFISLRVYPFPLVNVSTYSGTGDNKIRIGRGAVPLTLGSTPNVGTISQYADILDAGTVQVPAYYGDFRDYAQTDVILHAPYIGTVNLAAADVIGATLHLVYAIDFAAGSCTAYLDISRGGFTYPVCLGSGVIGADVPLTADSASRRAAALFGLGDAALSNIGQNASAERGAEGELDLEVNPYGMLAGAARGILGANPIAPTMSGIGKGFDSFAGAQTAYIQIRRAITKNPGNQDKTYGKQTAKSARLGDLSGFTVCQNVDVSGLDCDLETKTQIKRLLETGVYI